MTLAFVHPGTFKTLVLLETNKIHFVFQCGHETLWSWSLMDLEYSSRAGVVKVWLKLLVSLGGAP